MEPLKGQYLPPLLFIIYTSDFHHVLNNFSLHPYADDTNLYYTSNINQLVNMEGPLNKDIKDLVKNIKKSLPLFQLR